MAGLAIPALVSDASIEDRQKALKFAFGTGAVDAVTIGYKSTAEIDEAIANLNLALNG